jgi:hypothetical protein
MSNTIVHGKFYPDEAFRNFAQGFTSVWMPVRFNAGILLRDERFFVDIITPVLHQFGLELYSYPTKPKSIILHVATDDGDYRTVDLNNTIMNSMREYRLAVQKLKTK